MDPTSADISNVAHWKAVESPHRILHRDISTGNLLIIPRVIIDQVNKTRTVVWKGILTDWELGKQLPADEDDVEVMRQPSRTVSAYIFFGLACH